MASIGKNGKGKRLWLRHVNPKKQIYLGKITARQEREILRIVEPLEEAAKLGIQATQTQLRAADDLNSKLREKLRNHGLLNGLNARLTIGEFGRSWIDSRNDISAKRKQAYLTTIEMLEDHFGKDVVLNDITVGQAKAYRNDLAQGVADSTVGFRIKMIKCMFNAAIDFGHILSNPFAKVSSGSKSEDRFEYVSKETINAIIDDVSCLQWKVIIALWRFGGLRQQEPMLLTWADVDWANLKLTVHDSKRKQDRVLPLWPEVEKALSDLFAVAEEGQSRIITIYKHRDNVFVDWTKKIKQAGFTVWGKPCQNLRASCENDLDEAGFRHAAICSWMGHTKVVSRKHYLHVTDSDFDKAVGGNIVPQIVPSGTAQASTQNQILQLNKKSTDVQVGANMCSSPKMGQDSRPKSCECASVQ